MPSNSQDSTFSVIYPKIGEGIQVVPSTYGYASGYDRPREILEQMNILHRLFPFLACYFYEEMTRRQPVPMGAEGWFAIPRWEMFGTTYNQAVRVVLGKLKTSRDGKLYSYCLNKLDEEKLSQHGNTTRALDIVDRNQYWYPVRLISAQFGFHYRGYSPYYAKRSYREKEFGLGLFEVVIMLLTHPERLNDNNDLWVECPGSIYSHTPNGTFCKTPFLNIVDGEIGIGTAGTNDAGARFGSATGFTP